MNIISNASAADSGRGSTLGALVPAWRYFGRSRTPFLHSYVLEPHSCGVSAQAGYSEEETISELFRSAPAEGLYMLRLSSIRQDHSAAHTELHAYVVSDESAFVTLASSDSSYLRECLSLLFARSGLLTSNQLRGLVRQLTSLLSDEDELQKESIEPSVASLDSLIDFLSDNDVTKHPRLSLSRTGNFSASWAPTRRAKLTITFKPYGVADWIGVDLDSSPPIHARGHVAGGLPQTPFSDWIYT